MKYNVNKLAAVCFFVCLLTISSLAVSQQAIRIPDQFTLELKFGDKNLPDDYLIAGGVGRLAMAGFAVDNRNNMYLFDEKRIKVYDPNGKSKAIIGSPGQGPGEFAGFAMQSWLTISPAGYISALNKTMPQYSFNIYNPEFEYLRSIYTVPFKGGTVHRCNIMMIASDEYLAEFFETEEKDNLLYTKFSIKHVKNKTETEIASYTVPTDVVDGRSRMSISYMGKLYWQYLPGGKVVFMQSRFDSFESEDGSVYKLHSHDLNTGNVVDFSFPYNPVALTKEELKTGGGYGGINIQNEEKMFKMRVTFLNKNEITDKEALRYVIFDGNYAFAFTNIFRREGDDNPEYFVEVLNIAEGKKTGELYLPDWWFILSINNGYAYLSGTSDEGFTRIEKYRINPAVYGK